MAERPFSIIGKPFRRVDGRAKVTGQTRFADDLFFPRMCFMRLVRSTVPHARIRGIASMASLRRATASLRATAMDGEVWENDRGSIRWRFLAPKWSTVSRMRFSATRKNHAKKAGDATPSNPSRLLWIAMRISCSGVRPWARGPRDGLWSNRHKRVLDRADPRTSRSVSRCCRCEPMCHRAVSTIVYFYTHVAQSRM